MSLKPWKEKREKLGKRHLFCCHQLCIKLEEKGMVLKFKEWCQKWGEGAKGTQEVHLRPMGRCFREADFSL
jgi:hypothetical protein